MALPQAGLEGEACNNVQNWATTYLTDHPSEFCGSLEKAKGPTESALNVLDGQRIGCYEHSKSSGDGWHLECAMTMTVLSSEAIQAAPRACLFGNPNRHVSLWDMLKFHADDFCRASGQLGQMYMDIRHGALPHEESWRVVRSSLTVIEGHCRALGLPATIAQIARVRDQLRNSQSVSLQRLGDDLMQVHIRMVDELEARKLFVVDSDKVQYLESSQFSESVGARFPDALFDMEEAARCYAFGRSTACVFHLMRVTEYGLRGVSEFLQINDPLGPNWDQIIKKIDAELKLEYKARRFKSHKEFLSHTSAHLNAVKIAWRDRTMHIDKKHTMEEARDIYNATCGLMRYLAENLPKPATGIVKSIRGMMGS